MPREGWVERLNAFTITHEGWTASLEVFGLETEQQPAIVNLPLIGVSADRVDHDGTVAISVALSAGEHLTHVIHDVARIYIDKPDDGSTAALIIESADGTTTTVHLRATSRSATCLPLIASPAPSAIPGVAWSDHWSFWKHGYRALMLTDTALYRYPHYHSNSDTADRLDYERMARVVTGCDAIIQAQR